VCDGIDNDCNDAVDEAGELEAYADVDADGFGTGEALGLFCDLPAGTASNPDDCDDTNAAVSPVAEELCDGVDNDCDARVDADALDGTLVYDDADLDGFGNAATGRLACELVDGTVEDATDCDDTDVQTYPGAPELCDLEDNNCDGTVDEGSPEERSYYQDADADGYGDAAVSVAACGAPAGYVELGPALLKPAAPVNDAGQAVGHHRQQTGNASEQKNGRHGQLNGVGNVGDGGGDHGGEKGTVMNARKACGVSPKGQ
jgi:hypothetical protein